MKAGGRQVAKTHELPKSIPTRLATTDALVSAQLQMAVATSENTLKPPSS
jgi:hypothetical protein